MTQTILTAGDLSNGTSLLCGNDGTLVLQSGLSGAKVNALSINSVGVVKTLDSAWPVFAATGGGGTPSGDGVYVEVTGYSKTFDNANTLTVGTGRFNPQVAGYYQINATLVGNSTYPLGMSVDIYKNGTGTGMRSLFRNTTQAAVPFLSAAGIVFLNGSTDYISIFGSVQGGTTPWTLSAGVFSGALIKAA
jgi:hypothetical protein